MTCIALSGDADRAEQDLVAAWLLCLVGLAIDRRTTKRGRIGLVVDNGIAVDLSELRWIGWEKGSKRDDYNGDYFVLAAPDSKKIRSAIAA